MSFFVRSHKDAPAVYPFVNLYTANVGRMTKSISVVSTAA